MHFLPEPRNLGKKRRLTQGAWVWLGTDPNPNPFGLKDPPGPRLLVLRQDLRLMGYASGIKANRS